MSSSLVSMGRLRSLLRNSVKDTFPEPSASRMEKLGHGARAGGGAGSERSSVSAGLPATPSAQVVREGLVGRVLLKVVVHLGGHDSEELLQGHLARTIGIHLLPVDHDMGKKTPGHMRQAMGSGPLAARTAGSPPRPG